MKKGILLFIAILGFVNLSATEKNGVNYLNNDAVTFIEKGIEFNVFLNGEFDFNTLNNNAYYNNRNLRVFKDNFGRVRQIGNTVINYGHYGNVSAIGNIPVRYQYGQLVSVGNLTVEYDRWGYPHYRGFVKQNRFNNNSFNINVNFGTVWTYDNPYFYNRHFRNSYRRVREDANFYYYRAVPNAKLGNRSQIIKRRKPTRTTIDSNRRYLNNNKRFNNNSLNTNRISTPSKVYNTKNNAKTYTRKVTPTKKVKNTRVVTTNNKSRTSVPSKGYNTKNNTKPYTRKVTPTKRVTNTRIVKTTPIKSRGNTSVNKKRNTKVVKTVTTKQVTTKNNKNTSRKSRR